LKNSAAKETAVVKRPHFRVAAFGLPVALQRVAEIVFAHARHNPFTYEVVQDCRLERCDVALVDMTVRGNERLLQLLRKGQGGRVVLTVGRRGAASRIADDLQIGQFATSLLTVLNAAVAKRPRHTPVAQPPGQRSAVVDARLRWGRAPRALVVDDSAAARLQLMARLTAAGWDVQGAASLSQALAWLCNWPVDLVVSDWALSDGQARQLWSSSLASRWQEARPTGSTRGSDIQWEQSSRSSGRIGQDLRSAHPRPLPAWLLLTQAPTWWQMLQARMAGCAAVLDKPATPQVVLGVVERLLRARLT